MKRPKLNANKIDTIISLVDDLYWDWDRLSSSGQETLEKIGKLLGIEPEDLEFSLLSSIALQAAFCRLKNRRDSKPIPSWDNMKAQAKYWKRVYNTELGKGTVEHFIDCNKPKD